MAKHYVDERPFVTEDLAERIQRRKYYQRDENGKVVENTWEEVALRTASHVAQGGKISAEEAGVEFTDEEMSFWATQYFNLINNKVFVPGGRVLANAGTSIQNLINCYIFDIQDSREDIYSVLKDVAEIHAQGGGTGMNFSNLREEGAIIKSTGGKSSGPLAFMQLFETSADVIKQASRRGAMLAALRVDHPDIFKFVEAKHIEGSLNNFNISVLMSDEVMEAYEERGNVVLKSPLGYDVREISAEELVDYIAEWAWKTGYPGLLFIDTLNKHNPTPQLGRIVSTNPCEFCCTA